MENKADIALNKVEWRRVVILNRHNKPVEARLTLGEKDSGSSAAPVDQRRTVGAGETFTWGLRTRADVVARFVSEEGELDSLCLPFSLDLRVLYIVISLGGVRLIKPSDRRPPGMEGGINRVQVGCGPQNIFPDWWNVDIRKFRGIDEAMDVTKEWPYTGLDFVYCEQFIEHLDLDGALKFLVSAGRSLKKGGILRMTTPNLEWVLRTHYKFTTAEDDLIEGTLAINRAFHGWGHKFLYNKTFLEQICLRCGFSEVRFHRYGESDYSDLTNLERHGKFRVENGMPNHLVVDVTVNDPSSVNDSWRGYLHKQFIKYYVGGH